MGPKRGCGFITPLTNNQKYQIIPILMQDNFSDWPIYISIIAYEENLLFFKRKQLMLMLEISDFLFRHVT